MADEAVLEGVDQAAEREIQVRLHLAEGTDDLPGVEAPCGGRGHGLQSRVLSMRIEKPGFHAGSAIELRAP